MYTITICHTEQHEAYHCRNKIVLSHWKDIFTFGNMLKPIWFDSEGMKVHPVKGWDVSEYLYFELDSEIVYYILSNHGGYNSHWDEERRLDFLFSRFTNLLNATIPCFQDLVTCYVTKSPDYVDIVSSDPRLWKIIEHWINRYWPKIAAYTTNCFREETSQAAFTAFVKGIYKPL